MIRELREQCHDWTHCIQEVPVREVLCVRPVSNEVKPQINRRDLQEAFTLVPEVDQDTC